MRRVAFFVCPLVQKHGSRQRSILVLAILMLARVASANVLYVPPGGSVQNAINAALPGDEIVLESGATYTGALTFPEKGGTLPIIVRSSQVAPERRITPNDRALLASLGSGSVYPAAAVKGNHWHFIGLAFRGNLYGEGDIITVTGAASDILFDRLLIEGGTTGQKRAIALNAGSTTVTRCHIANIWKTGQDSQALAGWTGPGPFTITDNFLEAAGENVMFGGADSSSPDRTPSDILVEGNHMTKNLAWKGVASTYNVKNLFELKVARRVTVRGNLFEHNWVDAQAGSAIVITPRNSGNTAPWSTVEDVLFEDNTVNDTPHVFNISGRDGEGGPSGQARRLTFRNNLFSNVTGTLLQAGGEVGEITFDHNTSMNAGTLMKLYRGSVLEPDGTRRAGAYAIGTFTVINSLMEYGDYGIWGEGSTDAVDALEDHTLSHDWRRNVVAGERGFGHALPPDTEQPTLSFYGAQFNPDYTLVSGSPYKGAALDGLDLGRVSGLTDPPPPPATPTLTVNSTTVVGGSSVMMTLTNGLGGSTDWLALALSSAPDTSYRQYTYVGSGVTTRTWTVAMPTTAGTYEFRLFPNNSYTRAATSAPIAVLSPPPTLTSLSPAGAAAGGPAFTLTVTGTGFVSTSLVNWNGSTRPTTFVSSTQLRAAIGAADVLTAGSAEITVTTPEVAGGTSGVLLFTIAKPTLSVSATTVQAGSPVTVTLANGSGGVGDWLAFALTTAANTSYVQYTYVGTGTTTRTWTIAAPATAGTYEFRLFGNNSYTRMATSPPVTVAQAASSTPVLTSLSPARGLVGSSSLTVSAIGSGFVSGSVILWNGVARTTSYVSATELRTTLSAADLATTATALVSVSSQALGGGTSSAVTFTVVPAPVLTVDATSVRVGATVTMTLAGGLGGARDWLALAAVGAANTSYVQFTYVGNGLLTRTWIVTMPSTPGTYEFRLFLNNTYTPAAKSSPITVTP